MSRDIRQTDALVASWRVCAGLFAISLGTVLLEVNLIRLFSFMVWYHFAYLIISVAMLGFGAAGTFLARYPGIFKRNLDGLLSTLALLASLAVCVSFAVITKIPFSPRELPAPPQFFYLTAYYLSVFVPFFLSGLVVAIVLAGGAASIGRLYFWDLIGAGAGSLSTLAFILWLGVPATTMLSALAFAAAGLFFCDRPRLPSRVPAAIAIAALCVVTLGLFPVLPSPSKVLSFYLGESKTGRIKILSSEWHPVARVDTVEYPAAQELQELPNTSTPLWYGSLPADRRILYDGDASPSIIRFNGDFEPLKEMDQLLQRTPYLILDRPNVLIIGLGGGFDVLVALRNRASRIVGVDVNPVTVEIVRDRYADFAGHIYQQPNVEVHAAEGRNFVARTPERFDLVQMTTVDTLVARTLGAYILAENYLFTVDAINDILDHLTPSGIFSVVDGDPAPGRTHRHALREAGIIMAALRQHGITDPGAHMMVVSKNRGIVGLVNTLVRLTPFRPGEVVRVRAFAEANGFAIYHVPGSRLPGSDVSELINMMPKEREAFYDQHYLNLRPTTDDSPFFFNFYKWRNLFRHPETDLGRETAIGQIVLVAILVQALVSSVLFILVPLPRLGRVEGPPGTRVRCLAYFSALGIGFMFLEISFIQRFVLFLGNPAYAVSVVLAGLLVSSGLGSYRIHRSSSPEMTLLRQSTIALVLVTLAYVVLLSPLFHVFLDWHITLRFLISLMVIAPLGVVLGSFLPVGVRIVARIAPELVPWAWGINTCMSVISTVLSVILAMSYGFRTVSLFAIAVYLVGVGALHSLAPEASQEPPMQSALVMAGGA